MNEEIEAKLARLERECEMRRKDHLYACGRVDELTKLLEASRAERDGWRRDCLAAVERERALRKMIAKARRVRREGHRHVEAGKVLWIHISTAYRALDTRRSR